MISDDYVADRLTRRVVNLDVIRDNVADINIASIGGLLNFQSRALKHRHVERQRRDVVDRNGLVSKSEAAAASNRLSIESVNCRGVNARC